MNDQTEFSSAEPVHIPEDFLFDREHPVLPVPFTVRIGDHRFPGLGLSITGGLVEVDGMPDDSIIGTRHIAKFEFNFEGFSIDLYPEVQVAASGLGEMRLQFIDPTGPHLPQLRYILNSFIAGDFVSLGSMLAYSGPTKPKPPKESGAMPNGTRAVRRAGAIVLSVGLIALAIFVVVQRYMTSYEMRPVFIARSGSDMRATSAGQISLLNTEAKTGEVVYAISANSGDTLNFMLPCDCEIALSDGIYKGATVLPSDPILTFFDNTVEIRVQTQMSVEGLTKAVNGERVYLDLSDGRAVPVKVVQTSATSAAALRGDLYMPVVLLDETGVLTAADIGKPARVRLTRSILGGLI